jgi:hypothetical protein
MLNCMLCINDFFIMLNCMLCITDFLYYIELNVVFQKIYRMALEFVGNLELGVMC